MACKKVNNAKWTISEDYDLKDLDKFFEKNIKDFPFFGRDIENLFVSCKFMHSRRVLGKHPRNKCKLNAVDMEKGLKRFKKTRNPCMAMD